MILTILFLIFIFLMLFMSLQLYRGKCSWFIAGYNMMSKKEKSKYNELLICKNAAKKLLFVCIGLSVLYLFCLLAKSEKTIITAAILFCLFIISISVIGCKKGFQKFRK